MVEKIGKNNLIVPAVLSLVLGIIYFTMGSKLFLAATVLAFGGFLSLIDFRIALFGITFLMPFLPNVLALLGFLGVGFLYFARRIFVEKNTLVHNVYSGIIAIYLAVIIIQTITSVDFKGSLRDLGFHIGGLAYVFALVNTIKTRKDFNAFITVLLASVTIVALIGVLQIFTGVEIRREWLDIEANPDIRVRVFSVFGNPNTLAEYLVLFTPLGVGMFWHTKNMKKKFVFGAAVTSMLLCLIYTMSRGGWIGIAMAALVFCLIIDKRLLLLTIPLALGALIFLPTTFINRIMSIGNVTDSSNAHRFNIWGISMEMIKDNFFAGVGLGHLPFKKVFETYSRTINAYHAHNSFIQTFAELGFVGFTVFMIMLLDFIRYPIMKLVKRVKDINEDGYFKLIGAGVVAGIIGVFTHGLVENVLYLPKIIFAFWTLAGIGATAINIVEIHTPIVLEDKGQVYKVLRGSVPNE